MKKTRMTDEKERERNGKATEVWSGERTWTW